MQVAIIIPYRQTDRFRQANLEEVTRYYAEIVPFPFNFIVVEQSSNWRKENSPRHIHKVNDTGPFTRTRLLNKGVDLTNADILCFADNDIIVERESFLACLKYVSKAETMVCAKPFSRLYDLDQSQTENYLQSHNKEDFDSIAKAGLARRGVDLAGGVIIMNRFTYKNIGRWDERYIGWGCEDNAMSYILRQKTDVFIAKAKALHLYHPSSFPEVEDINYERNLKLFTDLLSADGLSLGEYFKLHHLL